MPVTNTTAVDAVGRHVAVAVEAPSVDGGPSLRTGDPQFWARTPLVGETMVDAGGARMEDVLRELKTEPVGTRVELDFVPSPESLRAVAYLGVDTTPHDAFEVFIGRRKNDGGWFMVRGDLHGVKADASGCDVAIHNHVHVPMVSYSSYPTPEDLVSSAGIDGRFMVISVDGVVEWSPDVPYPNEPDRKLGLEGDVDEWFAQLNSGLKRKLVLKLTFPSGYPSLLKSIGVRAERTRWRNVTQDLVSG
jgi:hypothetical protein